MEMETAALITSKLRELSSELDIRTGIGGHGQVAIFKNGPGPTILLRADIDALPVAEKTGLDYASTKMMDGQPVMHACGHDVHTTVGLGTAMVLSQIVEELPGKVRFLFQPAEEIAQGATIVRL